MTPPYKLHFGDCIDNMRAMPDNSVDSIVTDPPYELGFMGKAWDSSGIAYNVTMWREALRVLKPGGHLLAFSGSRTYHRMTCAIEDAGFEVRDQIMWIYGSGFPKSLDVSKAIDKVAGDPFAFRAFATAYDAAIKASRHTHSDVDRALGIKSSSCYWARSDHRGGIPPRHHWDQVRDLIGLSDSLASLYDAAEREVVAQREMIDTTLARPGIPLQDGSVRRMVDITAPATDAARQWDGWGTALKPAHEPICVARKPLIGTVAANVLAHGTGALNIDGCRVAGESTTRTQRGTTNAWEGGAFSGEVATGSDDGRWPANLIHDGNVPFPDASGAIAPVRGDEPSSSTANTFGQYDRRHASEPRRENDKTAARFFYCAKASKADREDGNTHPTVKPTDLMAYLCRLVTPPGGIVLDPFMGSGSTGKACMREGFRFIGIDMTPDYLMIAAARIGAEWKARAD